MSVKNKPPTYHGGTNMLMIQQVSRDSFFYADYHSFAKFRNDYFEKFKKQPYVSPPVRWQWQVPFSFQRNPQLIKSRRELSSHITAEEHAKALERLEVYREWFTEHVPRPGERDTMVLIPIENISPRYRDEPSA